MADAETTALRDAVDLDELLRRIEPASVEWLERAQQRQNTLTKPPGSLGRLEDLANRLCSIQRTLQPSVAKPCVYVFAADHGVCEERVNPYPQSVTRQMLANFASGGAAINALARAAVADLRVADMGVIGLPLSGLDILSGRVAEGTRNFCLEPAMSRQQAVAAMSFGVRCAEQATAAGSKLLAVGEMGIGNTTVASALCAALTGSDPELVCGRGTGSDDAALQRKLRAVIRALALHTPNIREPLDLLSCLGGFEIAAITGFCLSAAAQHTPVLLDGFITAAAAAIAVRMHESVGEYLIAAHRSAEPGHRVLLAYLKLEPLLELNMRLGEGSGAALAIPIVRAAVEAFSSMATFASAGVSDR